MFLLSLLKVTFCEILFDWQDYLKFNTCIKIILRRIDSNGWFNGLKMVFREVCWKSDCQDFLESNTCIKISLSRITGKILVPGFLKFNTCIKISPSRIAGEFLFPVFLEFNTCIKIGPSRIDWNGRFKGLKVAFREFCWQSDY